MPLLGQPAHHAVGRGQAVGAAAGQADGVRPRSTRLRGSSRSVSRVPGRAAAHVDAADGARRGRTTVVPVAQPRPVRWWWPTSTPATSVMALAGPGVRAGTSASAHRQVVPRRKRRAASA